MWRAVIHPLIGLSGRDMPAPLMIVRARGANTGCGSEYGNSHHGEATRMATAVDFGDWGEPPRPATVDRFEELRRILDEQGSTH
jgi:hypothetical protein